MESFEFSENAIKIVQQIAPNAVNATANISSDFNDMPVLDCMAFSASDGFDMFLYRVHNAHEGSEFLVEVFKLNMLNMFMMEHETHVLTFA